MSTSKLKIYKTRITPDRNCMIDDIQSYLATCAYSYSNDDFQYQKLDVDIFIDVPLSQDKQTEDIGNYVDLFQDGRHFYFFINGSPQWLSQSALRLSLSMDTVNTFTLDTDYTISNKSQVIRKHKDRFNKTTKVPGEGESFSYTFTRSIDRESEGLSGLLKTRENVSNIVTNNNYLNFRWNLVYINSGDEENPKIYDVYLYPEDDAAIPLKGEPEAWASFAMNDGQWYFILRETSSLLQFRYKNDAGDSWHTVNLGGRNDWNNLRILYLDGLYDIQLCNDRTAVTSYYDKYAVEFTNRYSYWNDADINMGLSVLEIKQKCIETVNTSFAAASFDTISAIDRSRKDIISIIECPYCPIKMTWTDNVLDEGDGYSIDIIRRCVQVDDKYLTQVLQDNITELDGYTQTYLDEENFKTALRTLRDSKLYHSDIYEVKYQYGDNGQQILLENIDLVNSGTIHNDIVYKQSNQITSDKIFNMTIRKGTPTNDVYRHMTDYDTLIYSQRNDQLPLFNSQYLDYIRNGYNYDKQAASRQLTGSWIGVGLGIVQTVGGIISSSTGVGAALAISGVTTTISSITNAINTTANNEASIYQKLSEAKNQANSISNINDIDLVNYYDGNKLKKYIYNISSKQRDNVDDLFYYCGYAHNVKEGINLLSLDTRYWFNYIQADIKFENYDKIVERYLNDLKARYSLGITRYHCNTISGVKQWDWNQQNENWEKDKFEL